MAAVNACFVPDDGVVSTNGGTPRQQPISNTADAETAQQRGAVFWPGNNTYHTLLEVVTTLALNYVNG
jgi:hypothetical protein